MTYCDVARCCVCSLFVCDRSMAASLGWLNVEEKEAKLWQFQGLNMQTRTRLTVPKSQSPMICICICVCVRECLFLSIVLYMFVYLCVFMSLYNINWV